MVDPPDLYGRNSCVDPSELRRASSQQDAAEAEETPPSSSFYYAAAHTPRASESDKNKNFQLSDDDDVASRCSSHRDRFLSDAERVVALDPQKTRESFVEVDHREDQWAWHEKPVTTILKDLNVDAKLGLDAEAARKRLIENGPNSLKAEKKAPVYIIFLLQFTNVIIGLLMAAALASIALQEFVEGLAIIAIVTLNAVIATIQEQNASNALEALQKMTSPQCVVMRGGRQVQIPSEMLVTGDIVVLTTGDIVPADIRLIHSADFKVNEMILTGESEDVLKKYDADMSRSEKLTADNMVFASTSVATGNATGVVVETGMKTRVGSIAALLQGGSTDGSKRPNCWRRFVDKYYPKMTPLQQSLHHLGVVMGTVVLGICVIVFVVGMCCA
ncbi:Calcium-transporting ATPase sarcoplasmic/endoplasmic reticulum type [Phytophthora palmivora]|uniref:Calcium-transporting ATPase sarcoplasmic/endoplasmic reticulum type n=1 Tax=Phytophthora palmivora TaxID=4796 RepID=A0A2P4Y3T4_9STRA|nr:Calcium-transporting ATPase sarcoplasmic/endoplasmic reticulum type [Phytophthora palmivora]